MIEERELFDLGRAEQDKEIDELTRNLNWSNERLSLFKQFVAAYGREPTIENYVRVRRSFPEVEIQISVFAAIDSPFRLEDHFRKAGIDPKLVLGALDADEPFFLDWGPVQL
jgi:hypothetical protein